MCTYYSYQIIVFNLMNYDKENTPRLRTSEVPHRPLLISRAHLLFQTTIQACNITSKFCPSLKFMQMKSVLYTYLLNQTYVSEVHKCYYMELNFFKFPPWCNISLYEYAIIYSFYC